MEVYTTLVGVATGPLDEGGCDKELIGRIWFTACAFVSVELFLSLTTWLPNSERPSALSRKQHSTPSLS